MRNVFLCTSVIYFYKIRLPENNCVNITISDFYEPIYG